PRPAGSQHGKMLAVSDKEEMPLHAPNGYALLACFGGGALIAGRTLSRDDASIAQPFRTTSSFDCAVQTSDDFASSRHALGTTRLVDRHDLSVAQCSLDA